MVKILYTRVNIKIEIKGYPHGRICKLHFWLDGDVDRDDIDNYIENKVELKFEKIDKNDIEKIYVDKLIYTSTRDEKENFGDIIFDSITNILPDTKNNEKNVQKTKNLILDKIPTDELKELKNKVDIELLKRQYFLNDQEYDFYKINENIIKLEDVKDIFKQYNGDAFKIKKLNIRNILKNPLSN